MQNKQREKQLVKNTGILALGTLCSKIFTFFLLPLYTAVLSTEDYGTVDVLQTVASFIMPFVTLELSTGVFRYLIDKKSDDYDSIISSALIIEIINIVLFYIIVRIINSIRPIPYCSLFVFYFSSHALLSLNQNITRGLGNTTLYSIMSFVMTVTALSINLILILGLGRKGDSILLAAGISYIVASLISIVKQSLWKYVKRRAFSREILKEILTYCLPLIPNAVSWWVANASDRLIIRYLLGANYNGIYAAANKVPSIYINIYNVYNIAWIEALSRGAQDPKQNQFINNMFKKSIQLFGCVSLGIICCISIIFTRLIGADYTESYWHIYILLVAIFVNSLCSLLGGVFTSFKKSDIIGKTTIIGAITNIAVHFALVKPFGLFAASISTLISYLVIMLVRNYNVKKLITLRWPKKFMIEALGVLVIITAGYYYRNSVINSVLLLAVFIWSVYMNRELLGETIWPMLKSTMNRIVHRNEKG